MKIPETPADEAERLNALDEYKLLDTPPEKEFDELVELASQICKTPISLVTHLDAERQWFKASVGLDVKETSRDISFCAHAIHDDEVLVVPDAQQDARFIDNPLVQQDPGIRFYAGVPLINPQGYRLGTLCVIDSRPRDLSAEQLSALKTLSRQVTRQMDLLLANRKLTESYHDIARQHQKLEKLNQTNTKLLSIIAHDLKSPFTTISGFLELLEHGALSEEEMVNASQGLKSLLASSSDLLDNLLQWGISRISSDDLQLQELPLAKLTDEIISGLELAAANKQNRIINLIDPSHSLRADSVMLRFVIRNLVQNANKFTNDGMIEITAEETDQHHIIHIKDSGQGIEPERQQKLFDWNTRISTRGTSGEKGSGLGLLLCKEFAENHRGAINFQSKLGSGTKFSFSISKAL